ncbi:hypothetical protein D3C84_1243470 [compost metagenome]
MMPSLKTAPDEIARTPSHFDCGLIVSLERCAEIIKVVFVARSSKISTVMVLI